MEMRDAIVIIRHKFLQEQGKPDADPDIAGRYEEACEEYPATMKVAHAYWGAAIASDE